MRRPGIATLVYARLFPVPKPTDPTSFQVHVAKNLVPEVALETQSFYGHVESLETQYPGLDYAHPGHRRRLARFTSHRRLFRAFDDLRLTPNEIHELCTWQGTKSAKEKYEIENNLQIRDTTWDGIHVMTLRQASSTRTQLRGGDMTESMADDISNDRITPGYVDDEGEVSIEDGVIGEEDSEDELQHSIGIDLNRHLMAATAARARGEQVVLDADWEQWLKEAAERGASEAASLVGSSRGRSNVSPSYSQHLPPIFQSNPPQSIEVMNAPQYAAFTATPSSAPPTGTAM